MAGRPSGHRSRVERQTDPNASTTTPIATVATPSHCRRLRCSPNRSQATIAWPLEETDSCGLEAFEPAGESLNVTAYWALDGSSVTSFSLPLEIEVDSTQAHVIPATHEGGMWRPIAKVPGSGLPASWTDGFEYSGTNVRILTRHLSLFTLLEDTQAPTKPGNFKGTVSKGTFSLSWAASTDNSGLVSAYRIYANGALVKSVDGSARSVAMGTLRLTDTRSFQVAAVDEAGNVGPQTGALKVVPKLAKLTLAAAKSALKKRGFKTGTIRYKASSSVPKGKVVAGAKSGLMPAGAKIGLTVSKGTTAASRPDMTFPPPSGPSVPAATSTTPATLAPTTTTTTVEESLQPKHGRVLPFVSPAVAGIGELRQELGFGLLAAAFSIAVAAGLRARRPVVARSLGSGDDVLLWDQRIIQAIRRVLGL